MKKLVFAIVCALSALVCVPAAAFEMPPASPPAKGYVYFDSTYGREVVDLYISEKQSTITLPTNNKIPAVQAYVIINRNPKNSPWSGVIYTDCYQFMDGTVAVMMSGSGRNERQRVEPSMMLYGLYQKLCKK